MCVGRQVKTVGVCVGRRIGGIFMFYRRVMW